jgi:hypothetical protein
MSAQNLRISSVNGKEGPAALTNEKQETFDKIYVDNLVKRPGVRINRKKYKIFFSEGGAS